MILTRFNKNEYDHRDYNYPDIVDPVCHSCNKKRGKALFLRKD